MPEETAKPNPDDVLMERDGKKTEVHTNSVEIMKELGWKVVGKKEK